MYRRDTQEWMKHIDFILLDIVWLNIAFVVAFYIRHGFRNPYGDDVYFSMLLVLSLADLLLCVFTNNYKNVLKRGYYNEFQATLRQVCLLMLCATFYLFTVKSGTEVSRLVIGLMSVFYMCFNYAGRILLKYYLRKRLNGVREKTLLIVATTQRMQKIINDIYTGSIGRYRIVGVVTLDDSGEREVDGIPLFPNRKETMMKLNREWIDEVFIDVPRECGFPKQLIEELMRMGLVIHLNLQEECNNPFGQRQFLEHIGNHSVLTSSINSISIGALFMKRLMDIAAGIVGSLLTLVLTVILGPIIFIQSPGPIFFTQVRVGRNGKKFKMYKFRSMCMDAEEKKKELEKENRVQDGLMFKVEYDPRIIGCQRLPDGRVKKGIGNFIRDWSLDEFPQFFNILMGDMSLVGTRPPTVDEWERYDLHHRARLAIKPGLTGLWQVSGRSGIVDFEEVVKLDAKYISEWSIGKDIKIVLLTIGAVVRRSGAM